MALPPPTVPLPCPLLRPAWADRSVVTDERPVHNLTDLAHALGENVLGWTHLLLTLIDRSDAPRLALLAQVFPWHVHAYQWWRGTYPSPTVGALRAEMARAEQSRPDSTDPAGDTDRIITISAAAPADRADAILDMLTCAAERLGIDVIGAIDSPED